MGYTTQFEGELKFTSDLTASQLCFLKQFLDENPANHPNWIKPDGDISYIQYELTPNMDGIRWDGSEKFYNSVEAVNLIIANMQAEYPDFGLEGKLNAQGEEFDDRWVLVVENNKAISVPVLPAGEKIQCPHCEDYFYYEDDK